MNDLIWREDIRTALKENVIEMGGDDWCEPGVPCGDIDAIVNNIPTADRPQGEWIEDYNGNGWNDYWDYTCSNCGKKYERADAVLYKANYCPNCGAQMKGTGDE